MNNSNGIIDASGSAIEGISPGKLHTFIDRNAMRYIEAFSENKNYKRFTTKNFAAFFFPELWLLYRKMYLYALLKAITSICVTVFFISTAVMTPKINEIINSSDSVAVEIPEHIKQYDDWVVESYVKEYLRQNSKDTRLNAIYLGINIVTVAALIIYNLFFSLYADCIYRTFIIRNRHKKGGVSFISVIIPIVLIFIFFVCRIAGLENFLNYWM